MRWSTDARRAAVERGDGPGHPREADRRGGAWQGAQEAARRHHIQQVRARTERYEGTWEAPTSPAVLRQVEAAFAQVREAMIGGHHRDQDVVQELILEDLTRAQVLNWRTRATHDHQVVFNHIDQYGETSAKRLFTAAFVADVQRCLSCGVQRRRVPTLQKAAPPGFCRDPLQFVRSVSLHRRCRGGAGGARAVVWLI